MADHRTGSGGKAWWALFPAFFADTLLSYYGGYSLALLWERCFQLPAGTGFRPAAWALGLLAVAGGLIWLWPKQSIGRMLLFRTDRAPAGGAAPRQTFRWRSPAGCFAGALLLLTFANGWLVTEVSLQRLLSYEGLLGARRIFSALLQPNWAILGPVLESMVETVYIAFLATAFAIPPAFALSFFAARNLMEASRAGRGVYAIIRIVANFTRSVEPLVWAIIFSVWVGIGPFAGMLALMLHSVASLIKLYSEAIESIDRGPVEAIEATGAHPVLVVWYGVVPQVLLPYLSFTIYRWDINIRMATVIGLVGGGGVGTLLMQFQGLAQWNEVGTIVLVIALVVWVMDFLSAKLREALY